MSEYKPQSRLAVPEKKTKTTTNRAVQQPQQPKQQKQPKQPKAKKKTSPAVVILIVLVVIAVLIVGASAYMLYGYQNIYPGVTINNISVGGMSEADVYENLDDLNSTDGELTVQIGDSYSFTISTEEMAISSDVDGAIEEALQYGRSGSLGENFSAILKAMTSGYDIETGEITYDTTILNGKLVEAEDAIDTEAADYSYEISEDGTTLNITLGTPGIGFDSDTVREQVLDKMIKGDYETLQVELDTQDSEVDIDAIYDAVYVEMVNAEITDEGAVSAVTGVSFDKEAAATAISAAQPGETVEIPLILTEPEVKDEDLEVNYYQDVLSSFHTVLTNPGYANRTSNVKLACAAVNETILQPGEVFSFNNVVGERTAARGYKEAKVFAGGGVQDGLGGGICQVSSTIYDAALYANLEIVSRANHMFAVDYTELGMDATVYWGSCDFKFKNNTDYPIKIKCYVDSPNVWCTIYGTKTNDYTVTMTHEVISKTPYETVYQDTTDLPVGTTKTTQSGHTGYKVVTYRTVTDSNGNVISKTTEATSTYVKTDKIISRGVSSTTTTPAPTSTSSPTTAPTAAPTTTPTPTPTTAPTTAPTTEPTTGDDDDPQG